MNKYPYAIAKDHGSWYEGPNDASGSFTGDIWHVRTFPTVESAQAKIDAERLENARVVLFEIRSDGTLDVQELP